MPFRMKTSTEGMWPPSMAFVNIVFLAIHPDVSASLEQSFYQFLIYTWSSKQGSIHSLLAKKSTWSLIIENLEALANSPMSMVLRTRLFGGEIPTIRAALRGIRLFLPEVIGAARAGNDMCRAITFKHLVSARAAPILYAVDCILSANSLWACKSC